jgi:multidrug transporter EmrE-like cation transporter
MSELLLVLLGVLSSTLAQIMLKKSSEFEYLQGVDFFTYFIFGAAFYVVSFGSYAYLLKVFNISKISPIMTIATMIAAVIAGVFIFREDIALRQIFGIALGALSILLIVK